MGLCDLSSDFTTVDIGSTYIVGTASTDLCESCYLRIYVCTTAEACVYELHIVFHYVFVRLPMRQCE